MKMSVIFSLFFSFFLLIHRANAINITHILSQDPNFSNFNSYLTQTNLAGAINSRQTITVLAVDNDNLSPLSGKSSDVLKNILSVHVVLDYFDVLKLQKLANGSTTLTTLLQTSGLAKGQQGFLNVSHPSADSIAFGSAVPGSTAGSILVKSIASQPYNISVLQVSSVIIPQGLDGSTNSASNNSGSASPPTNSNESIAPATSPTSAESPTEVVTPSAAPNSSESIAPATSPTSAESPTEVVTPSAAPNSAPVPSADAPTADGPIADVPAGAAADVPSNAGVLQMDVVIMFIMALSTHCLASRI